MSNPSRATTEVLDGLIRSLGTVQASLTECRRALVDERPKHGTQKAYLLALMGETALPVLPSDLTAFASAQGMKLNRQSVAATLHKMQREGAVESVGRGRWRRVGPLL